MDPKYKYKFIFYYSQWNQRSDLLDFITHYRLLKENESYLDAVVELKEFDGKSLTELIGLATSLRSSYLKTKKLKIPYPTLIVYKGNKPIAFYPAKRKTKHGSREIDIKQAVESILFDRKIIHFDFELYL